LSIALIACAALTYLTGAYYGCGEYPPGPAEQDDVANGGAVAAGGPCGNKKKTGLPNIFHGWDHEATFSTSLFKYTVFTDWGYRPDRTPCSSPGVIRWRHSTVQFLPDNTFGDVKVIGERWFASSCWDGGRQCMTRRDVNVQWNLAFKGIGYHGYTAGCITTRIGPGGNHWRHVYGYESCASVLGRALARSDREPSPRVEKALAAARNAYGDWDRAQVTIEDFVDRPTAQRIERRCTTKGLGSASCRRTLWNAYTALSPEAQQRAAETMGQPELTG
jgi:hypothetical protein